MINLSTKFALSISTHNEDMNGDTKCRKMEWFEVVRGHSFDRAHTVPVSIP